MNLKNPPMSSALALVGVGLISLSGAIAFAASGRPALAAPDDDRRLRVPGVPVTAERGMPSTFDGPPPMVGMGAADGCAEGEPLDWFGQIRELPECWSYKQYDLLVPILRFDVQTDYQTLSGMFDLNGDGRDEGILSRDFSWGSPPPTACLLKFVSVTVNAGQIVRTEHCLLSESVISEFATSIGMSGSNGFSAEGWFDPDRDGDLDFVFLVGGRRFWIENTGFEATQPLTGDLDGDGSVGASDLTLLLGGWTGN